MTRIIATIVAAVTIFLVTSAANANGCHRLISTEETWSGTQTLGVTDCGVQVVGGGKLTIAAGTKIIVKGAVGLENAIIVDAGTLVATGTAESPIEFIHESGFSGHFLDIWLDSTVQLAHLSFTGAAEVTPPVAKGIHVNDMGSNQVPFVLSQLTFTKLLNGVTLSNNAFVAVKQSTFTTIADVSVLVLSNAEVSVDGCHFDHVWGGVSAPPSGSGKIVRVANNVMLNVGQKNTLGSGGSALYSTNAWTGSVVENNLVVAHTEAVDLIVLSSVTDLVFRFNTVVTPGVPGQAYPGSPAVRLDGSTSTNVGNILWGFAWGFSFFADKATFSHNYTYYTGCGFQSSTCLDGAINTVGTNVGNFTNVDPLFRNLQSDWRLQPGSNLANKVPGASVPGVTSTDSDGNPREIANLDVGAFESPALFSKGIGEQYLPRNDLEQTVTLSGQNLKAGVTIVEFLDPNTGLPDPKITITPNSAVDGDVPGASLTLKLTVDPQAPLGERWVRVRNSLGDPGFTLKTENGAQSFEVTRAPKITQITPNVGQRGDDLTVTITGSDFPDSLGDLRVNFDGLDAVATKVENNDTITVALTLWESDTLGSYDVSVTDTTTGAEATLPDSFAILSKPLITSVSPKEGVLGYTYEVTIKGGNFDAPPDLQIDFGAGTQPTITVATAQQLLVTVVIDPGATPGMRALTITNKDGGATTLADAFEIRANAPPTTPEISLSMDGLNVTADGKITVTNEISDDTPIPTNGTLTTHCVYSKNPDLTAPVETTTSTDGTCTPDTGKFTEDEVYYVGVSVSDADNASASSPTFQILYSAQNHAPTAPVPQTPSNDSTVNTLTPTLTFVNGTDPEHDKLSYRIQIVTQGSTFPVVDLEQIQPGEGQIQSVTLSEPLTEDLRYQWRVQAIDQHGAASPWSAALSFRIDLQNQTPSVPVPLTPVEGQVVTTLRPTLVFTGSTDGDGDPLSYIVEIDTVDTFDSANKIEVTVKDSGSAQTQLALESDLVEDATYYWRVRADDGDAKSDFSASATFVVSAVNNGPGKPVALSPKDNQTLLSASPLFTIKNVTDLEGDSYRFEIELYLGDATAPLQSLTGIPTTEGESSEYQHDGKLANGSYRWRVRAVDDRGAAGEWSEMASFQVKTETGNVGGGGCRAQLVGQNSTTPVALMMLILLFGLLVQRRRLPR